MIAGISSEVQSVGALEESLGNIFIVVQGFLLRVTRVRFLICGSLRHIVLGRSRIKVRGWISGWDILWVLSLRVLCLSGFMVLGCAGETCCGYWLREAWYVGVVHGAWYGLVLKIRGCSNRL